jgi:hypothetical protein
VNPDLVARVLALAGYARAAGCCPDDSLAIASGLVHGTARPEVLDADEPFITGVLREVERRALMCRSAGHR